MNGEENVITNENFDKNAFIKRLKESNMFKKTEINKIQKDVILYKKSYLLGILDGR